MKGFKAFEKGLICKGKQYAENTVFEEPEAVVCQNGMHFCKKPFDVLDYYPLIDNNGEFSEFAVVEALDEPVTDDNKKFCSKKLKIGAKLSFANFIKAAASFEFEKTENDKKSNVVENSGDSAKIGSSGNYAQITSEGKYSVICCTGHGSIAKGKVGSWITLSEWKYSNIENVNIPVCVKTEKIDGVKIKADTFYKLVNGEFVEVK